MQQVLEETLSRVLKKPVYITGCGRTDARVHASQFFFHADVEEPWDFDLIFRVNKLLPDDIALFDIIPMEGQPHARFDATERSYDYFIHTYKDPFLNGRSALYLIKDWDIGRMQQAAGLLLKYNDYHAFCKMPGRNDHTICNVSLAQVSVNVKGDRLRFQISANRFLGRMVRIIAGKLIAIGTGNLSVDEFEHYLINPQHKQLIQPAYPQGLYLSKVKYPYLEFPSRSDFINILGEGF
ncbi:tRNA pseudouridine synthase A [Mucilaginibacter phyllosphaerae]|nr:tRNA pseudouridine synthase A [Mucilaginibacter phyllosphaerae]